VTVAEELKKFDDALPKLRQLRNVGEHIDNYVMGDGRDPKVSRNLLQVGTWDGVTYSWLGSTVNIDAAHRVATKLLASIRKACAGGSEQVLRKPADDHYAR